MTVLQGIARLKALRARLRSPLEFYRAHLEGWTDLAQRTTAAVLANGCPPDVDATTWAQRCEQVVARVAGQLVRRVPVGVVLALGGLDAGLPDDASDEARAAYAEHPVTIDEVERWVSAGREKASPEDPGKNLDERDAGQTDLQIAWKVLTAINNDKPGSVGLMGAVQQFLDAERAVGDVPPELYEAVLRAWVAVFTPVVADAWQAWVSVVLAAA